MQAGHFSILRFYERRIRRIFPALFLVLAGVSCAAFLILFPTDLQRYAMSLIATAGFASNFHFLSTAGYFDAAAETKPLLHTWSLAVEEQFYLVFPALLYLVGRYMVGGASRRNLLLIVAGVFVASLAGGIVGLRYAPLSTFYLLPFRMWELMLGAMLAIGQFRRPASRAAKEGLALLGLGSIAWSVFSLTTDTPFNQWHQQQAKAQQLKRQCRRRATSAHLSASAHPTPFLRGLSLCSIPPMQAVQADGRREGAASKGHCVAHLASGAGSFVSPSQVLAAGDGSASVVATPRRTARLGP